MTLSSREQTSNGSSHQGQRDLVLVPAIPPPACAVLFQPWPGMQRANVDLISEGPERRPQQWHTLKVLLVGHAELR